MNEVQKKNGFLSWIVILIGIPILIYWLIGPCSSAWVQTWETAPSGYAILAQEFPTASAQLRADVSESLKKGYLTNGEVTRLFQGIVTEKGMVQTYPAPDFGDGEKSGAGVMDQILGKRQDSNAKRKLIAESENR
jgi:hypothetical protein